MCHPIHLRWILAVAGAMCIAPLPAQSQGARITGVVKDIQGTGREGVRVSATNTASGVTALLTGKTQAHREFAYARLVPRPVVTR